MPRELASKSNKLNVRAEKNICDNSSSATNKARIKPTERVTQPPRRVGSEERNARVMKKFKRP
jgi:hypothetical protein